MIDPELWSDADDMSYPSPAWKSIELPDADGMFHARVVRSGTSSVQVTLPQTRTYVVASSCTLSETNRVQVRE